MSLSMRLIEARVNMDSPSDGSFFPRRRGAMKYAIEKEDFRLILRICVLLG